MARAWPGRRAAAVAVKDRSTWLSGTINTRSTRSRQRRRDRKRHEDPDNDDRPTFVQAVARGVPAVCALDLCALCTITGAFGIGRHARLRRNAGLRALRGA